MPLIALGAARDEKSEGANPVHCGDLVSLASHGYASQPPSCPRVWLTLYYPFPPTADSEGKTVVAFGRKK